MKRIENTENINYDKFSDLKRDLIRNEQRNRELFDAKCAKCGKTCKVPFKPIEGKKVYCRDCYTRKPR